MEYADIEPELIFVARTALAAFLAFLIGWERETHGSPAGDRTFALVAIGAAAFTTIGVQNFPSTAEKLMAGVVTGVGFLGAGTIIKDGIEVRGLTTAAGLWAVAAIGAVVGIGEYLMGTALTVLILLILSWERLPLLSYIGVRKARMDAARRDN